MNCRVEQRFAVVSPDGNLHLENMGLTPGRRVQVIVLESNRQSVSPEESLSGTILSDERPNDPVIDPQDWDAVV